MIPEVIYEDDSLLAVNKPAGLLVHPVKISSKKEIHGTDPVKLRHGAGALGDNGLTLVDWLLSKYPQVRKVGDDPMIRPGIVHRLDKDTSGIILIAKTQEMFEFLKHQFQEHAVEKTYLAFVRGVPREREGLIDAPIGIKPKTVKRSIHSVKMAKTAVTAYRTLKLFETGKEKYSLLEVHPKTGRTHQIRIHLASIGVPIVGDPLYGKRNKKLEIRKERREVKEESENLAKPRLMLHAQAIAFHLPNGTALRLEADPPKEFNEYIEFLNRE